MGKITTAATEAWRARYAPTPEDLERYMRAMVLRRRYLVRLGRALETALADAGYEATPSEKPESAIRAMEPPQMS